MMSRGNDQSVLYTLPTIKSLRFIVRILNEQETGLAIRDYVARWEESGPDLRKLLAADPKLSRDLNAGRVMIMPNGVGAKILPLPAGAGKGPLSGKQAALSMFSTLITHPLLHLFGRCNGCRQYFIRNSGRQKRYCSPRCGRMQSARKATQKSRHEAHVVKIAEAQSAIAKLSRETFKRDWKVIVTERTGISRRWITRALNKGELYIPSLRTTIRAKTSNRP